MLQKKLNMLIINIYFLLKLVLSTNIDTFIPGYNIDIDGLSIALTNQYFDFGQNSFLTCPESCGACNDQNTCISCKFGFFQWSPVFNNNLYCVQCPMFNPNDIQNNIPCADCVMNPLTWQNTKRCSYKFTRIQEIQDQKVLRYLNVSDSSTQYLYQVYTNDQIGSQNIQVVEFPGGDKWCGYELQNQIFGLNCYSIYTQNPVDQSQTAVICRTGFAFNWNTGNCDQCPANCDQCASSTQCSVCSIGYTLGAQFQCVQCTAYIANCNSCYFQNSQGINFITNSYQSGNFQDVNSLQAAGFVMRCSQCSQNPIYFIPSLDLTNCENCSSINNCISCRYASTDLGQVLDHSSNPFIVDQSDISNYGKYCLFCSDPYFINYNGQCEICSDPNCEQCYYGSSSGTDSSYTLQQNFIYKSTQDNLILKCAFCIYSLNSAALMLDGTCRTGLAFLQTKDPNCGKWNQFKVLQAGASLDATYFQCVECLNGYGYDVSKAPQNRICDQTPTLMNVPFCTSFYYITINNVPQAVSCIRCQQGFTASAARGCVSCSSGLVGQNTMNFQTQSTCSRCSLISPTGFNYTYYLITSQQNLNAAKTAQIEIQQNLPQIPLCTQCGSTNVYGFCRVACFYGCYSELTYNACIQNPSTFSSKCVACGNVQSVDWNLSQSLSSDSTQCILCQRYCGMCQQRTTTQMNLINPYFNAVYTYDLQKYANQCIKCRTIDDICDDFQDPSQQYQGYHLDCTKRSDYIMNYDPNINQCTPCLKTDPSCTRILKIQQLIECRPNISADDLNLGNDQNNYFKNRASGNQDLSHIFTGVNVVFLDAWNPSTTLSINFQDFANVDQSNLQLYLALNEENVSNIEFELLFIPYEQQYTTNDKITKTGNTCLFQNDVTFSLQIAQHIANINILSLTFKTLNPNTGQIGQDPLDLFITQFSFSGWNYFNFENINFLPMYSLKPTVPLKNMLLDFSNNQFSSQLFLTDINFVSGYDINKQQTLLNSAKTIFCPVIDTYNMNYIQLKNVLVQNFIYQKSINLFKFNVALAYQTSIFMMNINKLIINQCQFSNVDFIQLYFNTTTIHISDVTIGMSVLTNMNFINQLPGHNFAQSQHSLALTNILFDSTQFLSSTFLNAYNLLTFKVTSLTLNLVSNLQYKQKTALITTNIGTITKMNLLNSLTNQVPVQTIYASNITLFQFPTQSQAKAAPSITLDQLSVQQITFQATNGFIMNLASYQNVYQVRGEVVVSNLKILSCSGDTPQNFLFYFSSIRLVTFSQVTISDTLGLSFIYAGYSDQITLSQGSIKSAQFPQICQNLVSSTQLNQYHGQILSIKNLRSQLYMENYSFQNLCTVDRAFFYFIHDQRDPIFPSEKLSGTIPYFISQNANQYDQFDIKGTNTNVAFNTLTFDSISTIVQDSNVVSSVFYFNTNIQYRNLLVDVNANNIQIVTQQDTLFKSSSAFINQDSNPSSLILVRLTLKNCNSNLQIQNGILFNGINFATESSVYDTANSGSKYNQFGYQGGFLNIITKNMTILSSKFTNSISDQGGAIYLKTFSTTAKVVIIKSIFQNLATSFNDQGTGIGGAISIDGTTSLTLTVSECTFDSIFSYKKGAILDLTCGQTICIINFKSNIISNVFAPTGSIFNVKFNKISQTLSFIDNKYSSNLKISDMIGQYQFFQEANTDILQSIQQFYIIYIQGGAIDFESNTFDQVDYLQGLLYVTGGMLQFNNNKILNSNFRFTPLVYFYKLGITSLNQLTVLNMNECSDCLENGQLHFLTNYALTSFNNFFLIESPSNSLSIVSADIEKVVCTKCTQGILGIQSTSKSITLTGGSFKNNNSNQGSLFIGGNSAPSLRMLGAQQSPAGAQITISTLTFQGNSATLGGGIYISYNNLLLSSVQLNKNTATQGGGIYFLTSDSNPNTFILQQSSISQNSAQVGGGIKVIGTFPQLMLGSTVSGNTAMQSGSDITSYPTGLKVYQNRKYIPYNSQQGAVIFNQWSPGVSTDQELFVYLTGQDGTIQKLDSGITATLTVSLNYQSDSQIPSTAKISGTTTVNYDSLIGGFYMNQVQFQQQPQSQLLAKLQSSIIKIPTFDNTGALVSINTNYNLPLIFNTRYCTIGEAFLAATGQCFHCANGTYSIVQNSTSCQDCPKIGVSSCPGGSVLKLQSGYWRPSADNDNIEPCSNQFSNCAGGKGVGDQLCSEGHIGALCEVCDISARFWLESYSNSGQYSCGKCKDTSNNTLKMVGLTLYTLIAIFFSVKSTKALLDSYIITFYFQKIGLIQKSAKVSTESVGIIIKLFTTYLQLIVVITTFNLQLPPGISDITVNVGDPVQQMSFSMDCGLYKISGKIPMTYFRLMWSQLMPFFYVTTYLIGHYLYQKVKKIQSRAVIAWIAFIYIYISMQPSIVKQNIQTISCRQISGLQYIKANVSELCYTSQHIAYMLLLILPTLILWVFLIPIFFLKKMYDGRYQLDKINMQYRFGFLYTEYKKTSYFWELVKVYQKTFITFFINIYDSYNTVKGVLVILVLVVYLRLQQHYQPYLEKRFNDLDFQLNLTVIASIIISMFILDNPFSYLIWFGYIIMVVINTIIIAQLIRILISGYTQQFEAKIGDKIVKFSIRYPKIAKYLNLPQVPKERIKNLWNKCRIHVKFTFIKPKAEKEQKQKHESNDLKIENYESKNQLIKSDILNDKSSQKASQEMEQVKIRPKLNLGSLEQIDQNMYTHNQIGGLNTGQNIETNLKINRPSSSKQLMKILQNPNFYDSPIDNNHDDFNLLNEVQNKAVLDINEQTQITFQNQQKNEQNNQIEVINMV
ncbi:transmembrane protein, putative (macronuclear) [Tetrahymena thermophila SB210]|uniref:Transmembrane protein, putative n=1 Tax=Tetrahymena thermophila (strain SB210) TaxID=312017 RepID=W7X5Y9_TETTS|nr:transmembrane protein, putative [Tetrahymena thermophila SB210]EWS71783.1 transmembrane protein, putative [Tetrahymena thermophila SB210]|eukprot:XP_012655670.1 transmembrane protein, putative [Tetrahymena thermophila SB210]